MRHLGRSTVMFLCAAALQPAIAQQSEVGQPAQAGIEGERRLEEIVVTAQRRVESMQRVPIAVSATTADMLQKVGVIDTQSLAIVTPGLQLNQARQAVVPFLRGVGSTNSTTGDEGSTAVYVDGIAFPIASANVFALNNIERVEVLKGPQGTLFGRNAVGGLINVITKTPSQTFGGNMEVGYGSYDTTFSTAYLTGPLSESVAADLALYGTHQGEGWGKNLNLGTDINRNREWAVRSKILAQLGEATDLTFAMDYGFSDNDIGSSRQPLPGTLGIGGFGFAGTIYDNRSNLPIIADKEQYGASLRIEHEFSPNVRLQSTSAYREYDLPANLDSDGTPIQAFNILTEEVADTAQQEFLLTGSGERLDWTAGVFYFHSTAGIQPFTITSAVIPPLNNSIFSEMTTQSYAAFGQGTFSITDSTRVTAGVRYTVDQLELEARQIALPGHPAPAGTVLATADEEKDFSKVTWRFALDHSVTQDVLAYASASRGYKSGVFSTASPFAPAVEPETLDAYEVGIKSDLVNGTLRLNLAAFYYDHQNLQVTVLSPAGAPLLINAAESEVSGADGELTYLFPARYGDLQLTTSFSYVDAQYASFPMAQFFAPLPAGGNSRFFGDATGNRSVYAPELTATVSVDYGFIIGSGHIGTSVTWHYNDGFFWDAQNALRQPSYDLLSAQITFTTPDDAWRLRLYGRNLLDEEYYVFAVAGTAGNGGAAQAPRTYGIALSRSF